ncbi:MAG: rod shape-determining protein MreC [Sphingobium sp.]|nr:rod shape-determining protein MreC [Sphingobium sp.]
MARPTSRRPGINRRAQYSLFASYVIAVAGAVIGLLTLILAKADPAGFAALRAAASEVTRPVSSGLSSMVSNIGSIDEHVVAYVNAGSQNAALRRQVDANRIQMIEARAIQQENVRLKKLLKLTETSTSEVATARLISSSSTAIRRMARISAGSAQGVRAGMPVRSPEGLIGRVLRAGPNSADILLLTDSQNIIPVRRASDNVQAISTGMDDGTLEIRPLNAGTSPFKPGDILVTTGTGGLYSPNIPVAVVVTLKGGTAIAVPLASPARVEIVMVEHPYDAGVPAPPAAEQDGQTGQNGAPQQPAGS